MANEDRKARGLRGFMVWIPEGLHEAVRKKVYRDGVTNQIAMTRLLSLWTGWKATDEKIVDGTNSGSAPGS